MQFDPKQARMVVAPAVPDAATVTVAPTAEAHNALVAKVNALLAMCRKAGLIALD